MQSLPPAANAGWLQEGTVRLGALGGWLSDGDVGLRFQSLGFRFQGLGVSGILGFSVISSKPKKIPMTTTEPVRTDNRPTVNLEP